MINRTSFSLQFVTIVCSVSVALTSCSKSKKAAVEAIARPVEPCSLLTSDEIKSVQGEPVTSAKPSTETSSEFIVSQCYFTTATPVNSVVVTITQRGTGSRSVKEFWKQTFDRGNESEETGEKHERNREEERESSKPERVEGIGDEAFWAGNRFGGALYILKDDYQVRLSIGGADDLGKKKEKCSKLARMILNRL